MTETDYKGKRILITGGTGSVGMALAKKLVEKGAIDIRILDNNENGLFNAMQELKSGGPVKFFVGDVKDKERIRRAMNGVDIVFHLAALKHVWICEYNPFEAVKSNIQGIQNVIDVAMEENVEKFIFTSSDKAVNPSNVMGTTKLMGEKLTTAADYSRGHTKTIFLSVRFGNILGSSGSVIPIFQEQIKNKKPVTVTDPKMTRFVISMDQATNLIFKAADIAKGGEVFILKMDSINIKDLAETMVQDITSGNGTKPEEIEITINEGGPGEKYHEDLMTEQENTRVMETDDMFIIIPEIKGLGETDTYEYANAQKSDKKCYNSGDVTLLSKEEISKLLKEEKLI
jgi:FlaA1/EpsC-like NDP-sugar epimerase